MLKIGLTGGIGSGKTTVANYFEKLGVPVIDADEISRRIVKRGLPAYQAIVQAFGEAVLTVDGELDRAGMRHTIFSDPEAKAKLESILHPMIREEIKRNIDSLKADYCIIAIPLLIETGQLSLVDRILVVDVDPQTQITRVQERDGDSSIQIAAIIKSQASREDRHAVADDILCNDGNIEQLKENVDKLHLQYLDLLRKPI